MKRTGFAHKARQALSELAGFERREVTLDELWERLDLVSGPERAPLWTALRDMIRSGEVRQPAKGVYLYVGPTGGRQIQEKMWSVVRTGETVTVEDLQQLAGASATYARQYLKMLVRRGLVETVRRPGGQVWRKVGDPGPDAPADAERAERYRRLRQQRKDLLAQAMELIDQALKMEDEPCNV